MNLSRDAPQIASYPFKSLGIGDLLRLELREIEN
jgi:hypothetical protein